MALTTVILLYLSTPDDFARQGEQLLRLFLRE
jgi:hypothetical protein